MMPFNEAAFHTIKPFVDADIPDGALMDMVDAAFTFGAPVIPVADRAVLELFHGPTAAFKDFGARFMARTFAWLRRGEDRPLKILVATSGDTGGAVAGGFFGVLGITVTVLYPRGRVSPLQERQIAGLGGNISALAVEGSFDDCQRLVKAAFNDKTLRSRMELSSANSINIARLIPQAAYYASAAGKLEIGLSDSDGRATPRIGTRYPDRWAEPAVFAVPSGNFGNLTAGIYAMKMGAPIKSFVAATNANKTVPEYLESGVYKPRLSVATISTAMDVGEPSNFERLTAHFSHSELASFVRGVWVSDDETRAAIADVAANHGYILDPHGAVGWQAANKVAAVGSSPNVFVVLATAPPAKFREIVEPIAGPFTGPIATPLALSDVMEKKVMSTVIPPDTQALIDAITE
jgi:threonine synthase